MGLTFKRKLGITWTPSRRAIDKMALWGQGADLIDTGIHAGVTVTQEAALQQTTVYACVRLLAESIAMLPTDAFRRRDEERVPVEPPPLWLRAPNPETTWFEFVERIIGCLNLDGNAFLLITARDRFQYPAELWTLNPRDIVVEPAGAGTVRYIWEGDRGRPLSRYTATNPAGDVLHIKAFNDGGPRGLSPIAQAKQAIGLALVTEKYGAKFFSQGARPGGVIEMPPTEPAKTAEYIRITKDNWKKDHQGSDQAHMPGVLTGGATWKQVGIRPDEAQFLETRRFQVEEIAKLFRVPLHLIQDLERATFSNIEHQAIDFVQYSLMPWITRLEAAFDQLLPRGQFVKWNVSGLLRGDMAARAKFYKAMVTDTGIMLRAEARRLEELPELEGLDRPTLPANIQILAADGTVDTPAPAPAPEPAPANDDDEEDED